jgi:hypothetical protein
VVAAGESVEGYAVVGSKGACVVAAVLSGPAVVCPTVVVEVGSAVLAELGGVSVAGTDAAVLKGGGALVAVAVTVVVRVAGNMLVLGSGVVSEVAGDCVVDNVAVGVEEVVA